MNPQSAIRSQHASAVSNPQSARIRNQPSTISNRIRVSNPSIGTQPAPTRHPRSAPVLREATHASHPPASSDSLLRWVNCRWHRSAAGGRTSCERRRGQRAERARGPGWAQRGAGGQRTPLPGDTKGRQAAENRRATDPSSTDSSRERATLRPVLCSSRAGHRREQATRPQTRDANPPNATDTAPTRRASRGSAEAARRGRHRRWCRRPCRGSSGICPRSRPSRASSGSPTPA